jgi:hypothetical protein
VNILDVLLVQAGARDVLHEPIGGLVRQEAVGEIGSPSLLTPSTLSGMMRALAWGSRERHELDECSSLSK